MQNQQLMNGLEEFFQISHPVSAPVMPVSSATSSIGTTNVVNTSASSGNLLIKFIIAGGVIFLVYYLANNYKREDINKRF